MTPRLRRIQRRANQLAPRMSEWRRHLHMNPEPSMKEFDTAAFVADRLREIGVAEVQTGIGETGVVGLVRGKGRKTVGLRADMDALELEEKSTVPYRSRRPGLMHACGHDGHVAGLLGVAAILQGMRDTLPGNVKLVFQPGEEGLGGAKRMIEDGVLESPNVSAMGALHVDTEVKIGEMAIRRGYNCAQTDDIYMTIIGKTGHAARPDKGVDAIAVASLALVAIQQFIGRHTNALDRKLVTFGVIRGGSRHNILADEVEVIGTLRTLEPAGREAILRFLTKELRRFVGTMGASLRIRIEEGYPPAVNDDRMVDVIEQMGADLLGEKRVVRPPQPVLGGEDFAYFGLAGVPSAMLGLGIFDEEKGFTAPGHNSRFDFDDLAALPVGATLLSELAFRMLDTF
jgi:amidohydrolase